MQSNKLPDNQRKALIGARGEPVLTLEFDVFQDNSLSMWTHFEHGSDFAAAKQRLILIRDPLDSFIRDQNMCPFHDSSKETR